MKTIDTIRLKSYTRKVINNKLYNLVYNRYFDCIPVFDILNILKTKDIDIVEKDFILCGYNSSTTFELSIGNAIIKNALLCLQWYKMPSNKYEINVYIS